MKRLPSPVSRPLSSLVSRLSTSALALSLALLVGCDAIRDRTARAERANADYRTAMDEAAAGHLDAAIRGLEKVVRDNPLNASARFQLASLLQEHRHDYLEAIRHYREYRMLSPKSDKSDLSLRREEACEKALAPVLAKKMGLLDVASFQTELAAESERLAKSLEEAETALLSARRENKKVVAMVKTLDEDAGGERPPVTVNETDLIDKGDEDIDREKLASDIEQLVAEEKSESVTTPFRPVVRTNAVAKTAPKAIERPETYVVQEGDTLYKLAIRFYGRRSAWLQIREANKAIISTDGRIRIGQTIRLP